MDVVGSEIGQKMRSAIKAKLTELGCYVDDELPDYVMVMVANKRTRTQMEDDLQLFLVDNTKMFVNWLHQVLKKLQEVTVTAPIKVPEPDTSKEVLLIKEHKSKEKKSKDKIKKTDLKKAKKKDKEKQDKKKDERKLHKKKKKSKHHEMIHPNVPPLLMNIEQVSEPSITDVFAGQILKRHGFTLDELVNKPKITENKLVLAEIKKSIQPVIDPATIPSQSEPILIDDNTNAIENVEKNSVSSVEINRQEQIKEINSIEAKIEGLKQKLSEQLESMSEDDEDFLNIRTEADDLMNDFAEDVFQEISQPPPATPPILPKSPIIPLPRPSTPVRTPDLIVKEPNEVLPQIELKLPKRPQRDRRDERIKATDVKNTWKSDKRTKSPERFTPERIPSVSVKSRLGTQLEKRKSPSDDNDSDKAESCRKLNSRVSVLDNRSSLSSCASVVRVRPRPRVQAPASSLLMKAMADAHRSLLNIPPKVDHEVSVKRALVLPMRRTVDTQKIVIQVPVDNNTCHVDDTDVDRLGDDAISLGDMDSDDDKIFKEIRTGKEEYVPTSITKKITNNEYIPSRRNEVRKASKQDDTLIIETINIHNPTVDKDKTTQFIVTMDGYHPNAFLAKKLKNEGILNNEDELPKPKEGDSNNKSTVKDIKDKLSNKNKASIIDKISIKDKELNADKKSTTDKKVTKDKPPETNKESRSSTSTSIKKSSSNTSAESFTEVIIKKEVDVIKNVENPEPVAQKKENKTVVVKKRKASPIVFDIVKKERETERVRTESVSSDSQVTITTVPNTHKYDSVPPLSQTEKKPAVWCRAFPLCRYGSGCAFLHPRCKFAAGCTRRDCMYSHGPVTQTVFPTSPVPAPVLASHVVPAANYKTITSVGVPGMCKYYPNCVNPTCHFYHPKPCRYGKTCTNKLECNFYHIDVPSKWKIPF